MEESSSVDKWRRKRKFALTSSSLHQEKAMISYGYIRDTQAIAHDLGWWIILSEQVMKVNRNIISVQDRILLIFPHFAHVFELSRPQCVEYSIKKKNSAVWRNKFSKEKWQNGFLWNSSDRFRRNPWKWLARRHCHWWFFLNRGVMRRRNPRPTRSNHTTSSW